MNEFFRISFERRTALLFIAAVFVGVLGATLAVAVGIFTLIFATLIKYVVIGFVSVLVVGVLGVYAHRLHDKLSR